MKEEEIEEQLREWNAYLEQKERHLRLLIKRSDFLQEEESDDLISLLHSINDIKIESPALP